ITTSLTNQFHQHHRYTTPQVQKVLNKKVQIKKRKLIFVKRYKTKNMAEKFQNPYPTSLCVIYF
ncbi:MAG: hypothetical protein ACK44G_16200, partial [Aphanizomenon sp.]